MINLLPEESKKEIRAARTNVTLLNYIIILFLGIAFLVLICIGVYFVLTNTQADAERLINVSKSKSASYTSVAAQGSALRAGLSSAKTILDQEVVYTKILTGIAALMPSGVVLNSLNLSPSVFGTPTTLQFFAKTTKDALALKDSVQTSPLFSNVSFQTLSNSSQSSDYPVSATLSVTINKASAR
jgi:Tfp pilus assembly protein PilN